MKAAKVRLAQQAENRKKFAAAMAAKGTPVPSTPESVVQIQPRRAKPRSPKPGTDRYSKVVYVGEVRTGGSAVYAEISVDSGGPTYHTSVEVDGGMIFGDDLSLSNLAAIRDAITLALEEVAAQGANIALAASFARSVARASLARSVSK
jgi:hypothetical protein